jgi:hypothetical protein
MNGHISTAVRKTLIAVMLVLTVMVPGGVLPQPVSAIPPDAGWGQPAGGFNAADTSPYDGTYAGTFTYQYRERIPKKDAPAGSTSYDFSEWTSAALKLTVTLKTLQYVGLTTGRWMLGITHVIVSDPHFGTGVSGITPDAVSTVLPGFGSSAQLPADEGAGSGLLASQPYVLQIAFPNGSYLRTSIEKNDLKVGFAHNTLSGNSWYAQTSGTGFLSAEPMPGTSGLLAPKRYMVSCEDWSLERVVSPGPIIKDVSGAVLVMKKGAEDFKEYDGTKLGPGDVIRTGGLNYEDRFSKSLTLQMPDGYQVTVGPNSEVTIPDEWAPDNYYLRLIVGIIRAWLKHDNEQPRPEVRSTCTCDDITFGGKGTDFTVEVDAARTITVMVFEGAVSVTDTRSKNSITLVANQKLVIPKTQAGLSQQDMLGRVNYLPPESVDRWWEKDTASGTAQAPAWYPVAHPDGSLSIGKVEVVSVGSRLAAPGYVMAFVLAAAVFFLVAGQVFAWQLRRRFSKTTPP